MLPSLKPWKDYLRLENPAAAASVCQTACGQSFEEERKRVLQLWEKIQPESVVCLGAGCLNDIPIREFLESGTQVTLVEWVPALTQAGLARKMIYPTREGCVCICCRAPEKFAARICTNFFLPSPPGNVCQQYQACQESEWECRNFCPGPEPRVREGDVSGGLGERFAESVFYCLSRSPNPGTALRRMKKVLVAAEKERLHMDLPSASYDLVVSAMVASQFNFEPLDYLTASLRSRYAAAQFSPWERRLQELRSAMFHKMVVGHLEEIRRLLKPGGRAYFSFEVFHRKRGMRHWFIPDYAGLVLQEISRRFVCCDDVFPPAECLNRMAVREGESIVQSFVLSAP